MNITADPGHSLRFILMVDACTLLGSHVSHWGHVLRSCLRAPPQGPRLNGPATMAQPQFESVEGSSLY